VRLFRFHSRIVDGILSNWLVEWNARQSAQIYDDSTSLLSTFGLEHVFKLQLSAKCDNECYFVIYDCCNCPTIRSLLPLVLIICVRVYRIVCLIALGRLIPDMIAISLS
jgi:hypothetical protein